MMTQAETGTPAAESGESPDAPVAALAYAGTAPEVSRRVVRLMAGFAVLYGAAVLLSSGATVAQMFGMAGGVSNADQLFSTQAITYFGANGITMAVTVVLIVAAAALRGGRDTRRLLVQACWADIGSSVLGTIVVIVMYWLTVFRNAAGGLPQNYALYWAGTTFASLLVRLVFPLAIAGVFGGKRGQQLVREAR